jgi:hypothetical protein
MAVSKIYKAHVSVLYLRGQIIQPLIVIAIKTLHVLQCICLSRTLKFIEVTCF